MHAAARVISIALLATALFGCGNGASQIHDAASLPAHVSVCGRTWVKDQSGTQRSLAELRALAGIEPVVVDPGLFAPCPTGPCTAVAQDGPCYPVVQVRVGEDAYVSYELSGGP